MLDFTFINQLNDKSARRELFFNIFKKAASKTGLAKKRIGLSLVIVNRAKIQTLNKKYLKKDKTTDVLSFPINAKNGKDGIIELGDIFICLPIAKSRAREEKINLKKELEILSVHGFLHLLGHDHRTPTQKKKMFALQDKILKSF